MGADHPVVLFDGVCNLCNGAILFIIRHDRRKRFRFAPLQSDFASGIRAKPEFPAPIADSIILVDDAGIWQKSNAVLRIARNLSGGWPLLYVFKVIPPFIRDIFYDWIARNRYSMFGKKDQCMIPTPELRSLFLT